MFPASGQPGEHMLVLAVWASGEPLLVYQRENKLNQDSDAPSWSSSQLPRQSTALDWSRHVWLEKHHLG